jgi:hypothetical protein
MRTSFDAGSVASVCLARRSYVSALGAFALAQMLGAAAYGQDCNLNPNPTPPSVANITANGTTYTPSAPLNDGQAGAPGV